MAQQGCRPNRERSAGGRVIALLLSGALAASLAVAAIAGTATPAHAEDEVPELIIVGRAVAVEGTTTTADVPVLMTGLEPGESFTFKMETADSTATAGSDYEWTEEWFTFTAEQSLHTFSVPILNDGEDELQQAFYAWPRFQPWWNSRYFVTPGTVEVLDDTDMAGTHSTTELNIGDAVIQEPSGGSLDAVFPVTVARWPREEVVIDYRTSPGAVWNDEEFDPHLRNAPAASPGDDYTPVTGTLRIPASAVNGEIRVPVHGDGDLGEPTELFSLVAELRPTRETNFSEVADAWSWGYIADRASAQAAGLPVLDVTTPAARVAETNAGTAAAPFHLRLTTPGGAPVHAPLDVHVATGGGTADPGTDYEAVTAQVVHFGPTDFEKTVTVPLKGDDTFEPDESVIFGVTQADGARVRQVHATTMIGNDDPYPRLSVHPTSSPEGGGPVQLQIGLSNPTHEVVTVEATSSGLTAAEGTDYRPLAERVVFAPGTTARSVTVALVDDAVDEPDETFAVRLTKETGAILGTGTGLVTIGDDDEGRGDDDRGLGPVGQAPGPKGAGGTGGVTTPSGRGYWVITGGSLHAFGDAPSTPAPPSPAVALAARPGGGLWSLDAAGGVHAADAPFFGSLPGRRAEGIPVGGSPAVDIAAIPAGTGYWVLDAEGGVHAFGTADYFGSIPELGPPGAAAVSITVTPSGRGYWVVDHAGGVFAFGDAVFAGSLPGRRTDRDVGTARVVGFAATADGVGYWLTDAEGGVHAFGAAPYLGSIPGLNGEGRLAGQVVATAIASTPTGEGYWIFDEAGGVFTFGDATFEGSVPGRRTAT